MKSFSFTIGPWKRSLLVSAYPQTKAQPMESPILRTTPDWTFPFMCNTTARSQMNATITLVPVKAKGKHTGDNSTSVEDKERFYTNKLTSSTSNVE